jgi:hypothetical protein
LRALSLSAHGSRCEWDTSAHIHARCGYNDRCTTVAVEPFGCCTIKKERIFVAAGIAPVSPSARSRARWARQAAAGSSARFSWLDLVGLPSLANVNGL